MKKLIVITALSLGFGSAYAQKVKEAEVPSPVKAGFAKHFPNTKAEKWEKEGANYEVGFDVNKVESSALFDANGTLLETENEIAVSALPKVVSEYITKNAEGKKIKEASKITDAKGTVTYEAEVGGADYVFDANGGFIKKEAEVKKEKK